MAPRPSGLQLIDRALGGLDPGLPLIVEGESGTGRSMLALQVLAATLAAGERAVVLTAEPPVLLLYGAKALGIDMHGALREGRLRILELDPEAAATLRTVGPAPFLSQLGEIAATASLFVMDSLTDLTSELLDEGSLRGLLNGFVERFHDTRMMLTVETEPLAVLPAMRRMLLNGCGAYVVLERGDDGTRALRVERTRIGDAPTRHFSFRIGEAGLEPVGDSDEQRIPEVRLPKEDAVKRHLLLVEPDPESRKRYAEWLGDLYRVTLAADSTAALGSFIASRPDVVLLSLDGQSGGYQVLRSLGGTAEWLPILVLVDGGRGASERIRPLVLGASDVVAKPVDRLELAHKLDTLLQISSPPPNSVDLSSLGAGDSSLLLDEREFGFRLDRVRSLGARLGLCTSLLAIRCDDPETLDAVLSAAEQKLRAEDAVHASSDTEAMLLLVGSSPEQSRPALLRLDAELRTGQSLPDAPIGGLEGEFIELDALGPPASWAQVLKNPRSWADLIGEKA